MERAEEKQSWGTVKRVGHDNCRCGFKQESMFLWSFLLSSSLLGTLVLAACHCWGL